MIEKMLEKLEAKHREKFKDSPDLEMQVKLLKTVFFLGVSACAGELMKIINTEGEEAQEERLGNFLKYIETSLLELMSDDGMEIFIKG